MLRILTLALALVACSDGSEAPPSSAASTAEAARPAPDPETPPTEVLQRFYDALAAGRVGDAVPLMVPLADAELRAKLPADLGKVVELCQAGELRLEAKEHKIQGRWACVVTRHALERDGVKTVDIRDEFLLRTPDGWRIASEPMRKDPAVAPNWNEDAQQLLTWFRANHDLLVSRYQ